MSWQYPWSNDRELVEAKKAQFETSIAKAKAEQFEAIIDQLLAGLQSVYNIQEYLEDRIVDHE